MRNQFISFFKSVKGSVAVEFAICMPVLILIFLGMWDLVNYCMEKARVQNQAMILAQIVTDPAFSLNWSVDENKYVDKHNVTKTFGLEEIMNILSYGEDSEKYNYSGIFQGPATVTYYTEPQNIQVSFRSNSRGGGSVEYIKGSVDNIGDGETLPIKIVVTCSISKPFFQFAFPSSVKGVAYSFPMTGTMNVKVIPKASSDNPGLAPDKDKGFFDFVREGFEDFHKKAGTGS